MIYTVLVMLGLAFGSFVTALVWRLHEGKNFVSDRSECESCGHRLGALDLVPLVSWLSLRGRCRYCHKPVSWHNPASELLTGVLFVLSYIYWPLMLTSWQAWASFGIWLVYIVLLVALIFYDLRWMLLPNRLVFLLMGLGLVDLGLRLDIAGNLNLATYVFEALAGVAALGGVYWLLHTVSHGRWVGFGDVKLGVFIGIVLGWQQALLVLFLANILGFLAIAPALLSRKMSLQSRLPFGPFLIVAFIIAGLCGQKLLGWYFGLVLAG